jgi:hypothetical protein
MVYHQPLVHFLRLSLRLSLGVQELLQAMPQKFEMGALPAQTVAAVLSAGVMDEEKVGASSLAALVECQHETV